MPTKREKVRFRAWARPRLRELDATVLLAGTMRYLGWFESVAEQAPTDGAGNPIPWYTYAALMWLDDALHRVGRVFEYGAGHSTLWWATRADDVVSVEHDVSWGEAISRRMPDNVKLTVEPCTGNRVEAPEGDRYVGSIEGQGTFDVIVVDGVARVSCAQLAPAHLSEGGLIVLDNSDRQEYRPAIEYLIAEGFTHVPFHSLSPGNRGVAATSVFSRDLRRWSSSSDVAPGRNQSYSRLINDSLWSLGPPR